MVVVFFIFFQISARKYKTFKNTQRKIDDKIFNKRFRKIIFRGCLSRCVLTSRYGVQRGGGFAWLRLPLNLRRGSNLLIPTALSAGLLPQSRKTARYLLWLSTHFYRNLFYPLFSIFTLFSCQVPTLCPERVRCPKASERR